MKSWLHGLFSVIFWLWNITFLGVVCLGILPIIGLPLIQATVEGLIPLEFFVSFVALIGIPIVCTIVGIQLRKQPLQLIRLFYGVEAPLFLLCLIRLLMLRELTAASSLILGTFIVCIAAFALNLLYGYGYAQRNAKLAWLQMSCHSLMLLMGLYVGTLLLFYAVPTAVATVQGFFSFQWVWALGDILRSDPVMVLWWVPISFLLFGFSATLFLAMPSALATFYIYSGYRILRDFASEYGRNRTILGSVAVTTAWMVLFFSFQNQPQIQAFKQLENPVQTDKVRQELLAKSDKIRDGLLNAYLLSYRYLSPLQENNHIREMYRSTLGLEDSAAGFLQDRYNQLMSPFLYKGWRSDIEKAEKLYGEFFDTPIQKGERSQILHALQSTSNQEEAKAGLLNINEERVWLAKQEVTIAERGDWADVELYEVYENKTTQNEEVFYYFSLPESAVLTGVWLGESENRSDRYPFQVSPRGAAQQVYNEQVYRNIDPALLEQVGPRHYRLRVFPVPARLTSFDRPNEQPKQHMWLTYKVMRQENGWALPQLAEKRNVFWTAKTDRIYNADAVKSSEDWLPDFIRAKQPQPPTLHEVSFPGGYRISAQPISAAHDSLPQGKRFAVILDRSRSMDNRTNEIAHLFKWLKENGFADNRLDNNDADLYLSASAGADPERMDDLARFNAEKILFYGTLQYSEMLQQFDRLRGETRYDAILLVTDEGSYELSTDNKEVPVMPAPLWMVHLGGLPRAYDDGMLKAIQASRGGVSTEVPAVFNRLATQAKLGQSAVNVVDGYAWVMENKEKSAIASLSQALVSDSETATSGFEPLAARQFILGLTKEMDGSNIAELDAIHAIAKKFKIVSPYSSMIVLVNEEQKQALKAAEEKEDRFDREVEDGKEQLSQPVNTMNVAVPEPEAWLGTLGAIAFLILAKRKLNQLRQ